MVRITGEAPALFRADGLVIVGALAPAFEVVDQVDNEMRGSGLARELKVLAREHVVVETEAEVHRGQATTLSSYQVFAGRGDC